MPEVTFSNGVTVDMCYPPPFVLSVEMARLAQYVVLPDDSIEITVEKQSGLDMARERYALKSAFRNLAVPNEWEFPAASLSEGFVPSDGEQGRLLDYVRHEFLGMPGDVDKMNSVLSYSSPVTQEEVGVLRQFFRRVRRVFVRGHRPAATQSA